MLQVLNNIKTENSGLGIVIKSANLLKQLWILSDITIRKHISHHETGVVIFIANNQLGIPVNDAQFVIGWKDVITYPDQNYPGRFSMKLDRTYDPTVESGPYWGGFLEEGVAPEVIGFGIPKGYNFEIKIIYTQLKGGT